MRLLDIHNLTSKLSIKLKQSSQHGSGIQTDQSVETQLHKAYGVLTFSKGAKTVQ
jgi:hypothetical protein